MPTSDNTWNGSLNKYTNERTNQLLDAYFTYGKTLENHDFKLTGG